MSISGSKLPKLLTQSDVNKIIKISDTTGYSVILDDYVVGEKVEIINGPFSSFCGEIKEIIGEKNNTKCHLFSGDQLMLFLDKEQIKKFI